MLAKIKLISVLTQVRIFSFGIGVPLIGKGSNSLLSNVMKVNQLVYQLKSVNNT